MLVLNRHCKGGGTVFPAGKSGGKAQRVVWHGTRVSEAAAKPPAPRHLADLSVFSTLNLEQGRVLRVTKRDCRTWFDQLAEDPTIGMYFARPPVTRQELRDAGLTDADISGYGADDHDDTFFPCSQVWPMGFSWSSCVAQETLLALCRESGMGSDIVLAPDADAPDSLDLAFAVATDDLMVFSHSGPGATLGLVSRVESTMLRHGVVKNPDKDIIDVTTTTCVGVDLVDGVRWFPPGARVWSLMDAVIDLANVMIASPGGVAAYMGVAQLYDLIRRLRLSVFHLVYDFSSGAKARDWTKVTVPEGVLGEMLFDMTLMLFGSANMQLPFLDIVGATGASSVFGHGGAIAHLPRSEVRRVAARACKRGGYVRLSDGPTISDALDKRLGRRHDLGLQLRHFEVIYSVRVVEPGHINIEEGRALLHFVKWVLRSQARFCRRVVLLVDSKVVIGAVTKGRSSSLQLNALLRKLAALCFAGGIVLHCVFVPTSHNPSDWPSRGGPETWPAALRRRRKERLTRCPACHAFPHEHPLHLPRAQRGHGHFCRGFGPCFAWLDGDWIGQADVDATGPLVRGRQRAVARTCLQAWWLVAGGATRH